VDVSDGRNSFHGSTGPQPDAGDRAALVVQKPLSGLAWATSLPRMYQDVEFLCLPVGSRHSFLKRWNRTPSGQLGCAHPRVETVTMTSKADSKSAHQDNAKKSTPSHPGMMGDGTEEQNLGQPGNPAARIKKDEVDAAFSKKTK
jgi:hypothetical protein